MRYILKSNFILVITIVQSVSSPPEGPSEESRINLTSGLQPGAGAGPAFTTTTNNRQVLFELACMQKLDKKKEDSKTDKDIEEQLQKHDPEYIKMIKSRPQLLKPTFTKNPSHGIFHKIETADNTPVKAKRRPMIADSKKAAEGRRVWEQMLKDGVIEEVKGGTQTDWTSSLHLANKAGGGVSQAVFRLQGVEPQDRLRRLPPPPHPGLHLPDQWINLF